MAENNTDLGECQQGCRNCLAAKLPHLSILGQPRGGISRITVTMTAVGAGSGPSGFNSCRWPLSFRFFSLSMRPLSYEERYGFDVSGFLLLPQVLSPAEAATLSADTGRHTGLQNHPTLAGALECMFAGGVEQLRMQSPDPRNLNIAEAPLSLGVDAVLRYRADRKPHESAADSAPPNFLLGGDEGSLRRGYTADSGAMLCGGVQAIWALGELNGGSITVVPASHRSALSAPAAVLTGERMPATSLTLELQAGDLLLLAATTLRTPPSASQTLLLCDFTANWVAPSLGYDPPPPSAGAAWLSELSPQQRAIVSPRLNGEGSTVESDGERTWIHSDTASGEGPSEHSAEKAYELWEWDLNGFMVLPGVMDENWTTQANEAVNAVTAVGQPDRLVIQPDVALSHQTDEAASPVL